MKDYSDNSQNKITKKGKLHKIKSGQSTQFIEE